MDSATTAAREVTLRAAVLIGLVLLAFHYSLMTLGRGLSLQTPLAYLALVPVIAVGLAIARLRTEAPTLAIHDRQIDWIVATLLLAISAAALVLLPNSTSSGFWIQRVDLLVMPIFVAGLIALLFGVRRVWSLRFPIAFLLLAWPIPYALFLSGVTAMFATVTASVVGWVATTASIATVATSDPTLFYVGTGRDGFGVSIGSACAGLNGFVGFLIIGSAMLYLVRGGLVRRFAWLALGLAIIFGLNVVRIIAILVAGRAFGQEAALDVLHPFAGLVVFTIGVLVMVALVPRFGLRFIGARRSPESRHTPEPVSRAHPALLVALGVSALLAFTNATYARFETISSGLGDARLASFDGHEATLAGWQSRFISEFPLAQQYFGETATWDRNLWWPSDGAAVHSTRSIYVDVLTTDDAGTLQAYNLEACYRFHGYQIQSIANADIGAGVQAQVIDYVNTNLNTERSALWWEWPYSENGETRYERIVILLNEGPDTEFRGVDAEAIGTQAAQFGTSDRFLVEVARSMVQSQLASRPGTGS